MKMRFIYTMLNGNKIYGSWHNDNNLTIKALDDAVPTIKKNFISWNVEYKSYD